MTIHFSRRRPRLFDLPWACLILTVIVCVQVVASATLAAEPGRVFRSDDQGTSVAVLDDDLPGFDRELVKMLVGELRKTGCEVTTLSAVEVCDQSTLSPTTFFLYVIPQCRTYPAAGLDALIAFASGRGHVLFLGGPFLDDPVWPADAAGSDRAAIVAAKSNAAPPHGPLGR